MGNITRNMRVCPFSSDFKIPVYLEVTIVLSIPTFISYLLSIFINMVRILFSEQMCLESSSFYMSGSPYI